LLIVFGLVINYLVGYFKIKIPDLYGILPFMGTLGLILIVLEGSLDLSITRKKKSLVVKSISTAIILFILFEVIFASILIVFLDVSLKYALVNTIPLGIISSAVAIPSASSLGDSDREFVVYESSFSDIIGILAFDFVLRNTYSIGRGLLGFASEIIITVIGSVIVSAGLALILHKIKHHVKDVLITTVIVLVYTLAKLVHMPSLLVVLVFGLIVNNYHLLKNKYTLRFIDFQSFSHGLSSFKHITGELTFIVRSFFFIIFGFYSSIDNLLNLDNLILAFAFTMIIFILRWLYFRVVLKERRSPLIFFAPRGLITILLFLSIPFDMILPFMNQGLVTQIIFISILLMTLGSVLTRKAETLKRNETDINNPG
jgi:hypothetical protein